MDRDDLLWAFGIAAGVILLGGGGFAVYEMTRGIRNNNPGNLLYDGTPWDGLANPPSDGTYCVFVNPQYGIRAMAMTLSNYVAVDGVNPDLTSIISRYAPPASNDTASYIADVSQETGLNPTQTFDMGSVLPSLIAAMIRHENGVQPYDSATIAQGIALAA